MSTLQTEPKELGPFAILFFISVFVFFMGLFITSLASYPTVQSLHLLLGGQDPVNSFDKLSVGVSLIFKIFPLVGFTLFASLGLKNAITMFFEDDFEKHQVFLPLLVACMFLGTFFLFMNFGNGELLQSL